ncbi:MAG: prealbumin-like fold domain-containing protein [Oscillospiraceae bacterium]|jgi:hypothetical protein|nr:prealbumin-like fold domain-containing protein [Oscillospiraceae bacterium]
MFNLFCGLFSGGGSNSQCAANVCFQAIDPNDCPICGAVYRLNCACGKYIHALTGRNGCVTFHGVCPGAYTLTQELAPYGYLIDGSSHTVSVSNNCCVKIDGLPMRCFQSINQRDNTPTAQSAQPLVNAITTATDTIEGAGVAGCKVKVEFPGPDNCCCCTCVRRNGTWSVDVPASETLLAGEVVTVTQCCPCLLPSDPVGVPVVSA